MRLGFVSQVSGASTSELRRYPKGREKRRCVTITVRDPPGKHLYSNTRNECPQIPSGPRDFTPNRGHEGPSARYPLAHGTPSLPEGTEPRPVRSPPRPATHCSAGHRTAARGCPLADAFPPSRAAALAGPGDAAPASGFSAQLTPGHAPGWGMVPRLMGRPGTGAGATAVQPAPSDAAPLPSGEHGRGRRRSASRQLPRVSRALPRASPPVAPRPLTLSEGARPAGAGRPGTRCLRMRMRGLSRRRGHCACAAAGRLCPASEFMVLAPCPRYPVFSLLSRQPGT